MGTPMLPILLHAGVLSADTQLELVPSTAHGRRTWHTNHHCGAARAPRTPDLVTVGAVVTAVDADGTDTWCACAEDPAYLDRYATLTAADRDLLWLLSDDGEPITHSTIRTVARMRIRVADLRLWGKHPGLVAYARARSDDLAAAVGTVVASDAYRSEVVTEYLTGISAAAAAVATPGAAATPFLELVAATLDHPDTRALVSRFRSERDVTDPAADALVACGVNLQADVWRHATGHQVWFQLQRSRTSEEIAYRFTTSYDPDRDDIVRVPTLLAAQCAETVRYLAPGAVPRDLVVAAVDVSRDHNEPVTDLLDALTAAGT